MLIVVPLVHQVLLVPYMQVVEEDPALNLFDLYHNQLEKNKAFLHHTGS